MSEHPLSRTNVVLEDLHTRLEAAEPQSVDLHRDGPKQWRCQVWTGLHSGDFGEGTGQNIAEAIEGALDDMEASKRCPSCGDAADEGDHYECFVGEPRR